MKTPTKNTEISFVILWMLSYPMFLPIFLGVFSIGGSPMAKNSDRSPIHLGSNKNFM